MEQIPLKLSKEPNTDSRIIKAAIIIRDIVYLNWRHSYIFQDIRETGKYDRIESSKGEQGFVDQYGFFYSRSQAARIAFRQEQTKKLCDPLFSEDLWDNDGTPRDGGLFNPMGDKT